MHGVALLEVRVRLSGFAPLLPKGKCLIYSLSADPMAGDVAACQALSAVRVCMRIAALCRGSLQEANVPGSAAQLLGHLAGPCVKVADVHLQSGHHSQRLDSCAQPAQQLLSPVA